MSDELWRAELSRHNWKSYSCGCGQTAEHVPADFAAFMGAAPESVAQKTFRDGLDNHVIIQSNIFEAAIPATSVLIAALGSWPSSAHRRRIITRIRGIVGAETFHAEVDDGRVDLELAARETARAGIWNIYRSLVEDASPSALYTLEYIEPDEARLEYFYALVRHRLPEVARSADYKLFVRRDLNY